MYVNVHVVRILCPNSKHPQHGLWYSVGYRNVCGCMSANRVLYVYSHASPDADLRSALVEDGPARGMGEKTGLSVNNSSKVGCTLTVVKHRAFVSCHHSWKNWCRRKFNSHTLRYLHVEFPRIFSIQNQISSSYVVSPKVPSCRIWYPLLLPLIVNLLLWAWWCQHIIDYVFCDLYNTSENIHTSTLCFYTNSYISGYCGQEVN